MLPMTRTAASPRMDARVGRPRILLVLRLTARIRGPGGRQYVPLTLTLRGACTEDDRTAVMTATEIALEQFLDDTRDQRIGRYLDFLRIPSISTLPDHANDCRTAAEWLAGQLATIGAENVQVEETGGHPIVTGDWLHAPEGAPTAIVYGHYDVQPVDPLDLWESPPFAPIVKGDRVQARGSADDKGQIMIHLPAVEALLATRGTLPVNLRFVFEGEEEDGSEHLDAWLEANRERLRSDVAIVSDTSFFDGNLPAITIGLRGICAAQIDVIGPSVDLHSGVYGGTVENPIFALAVIVAALKGPDGRIRVPGFYDDVRPLTASTARRSASSRSTSRPTSS